MDERNIHPSEECCQNAEEENENLRAILRWCAERLPAEHLPELGAKLEATNEDGGVTCSGDLDPDQDEVADMRSVGKLCQSIAAHFQRAIDLPSGETLPRMWYQRADHLLNCAREFEPKQPLMRRVRDMANVFEIVRNR